MNTAVNLQPSNAVFYGDRGTLETVAGNYDRAITDLLQSQKLAPKNADAIIWLHIAHAKSGTDDAAEIEREVTEIDQTRWPAPIIALYRRQIDPQKLLETAAQNRTDRAKPLRCVIYFHVAVFETFNRDFGQADDLFRKAIDDCASYSLERVIAQKELKAQGR